MINGDKLFNQSFRVLGSVLDRRSSRHTLLTSNIANLETPNYKGRDLAFQARLKRYIESGEKPVEITRTNARHFPRVAPNWGPESQVVDTGPVKLDVEMAKLAENNLMYNALVQVLAKKYSSIRNAIVEGSK
jgi:flagellar basal-body rod protein FlgB